MPEIKDLHLKAMEFAEKALELKRLGKREEARKLFEMAFENEKKAAEIVKADVTKEPTRSVLLRSAATLALDCEQYREAERLISIALSGNPPNEIANELRDLHEQVNFERHLDLQGMQLAPDQLQLSLAGPAVGLGIAKNDDVLEKLSALNKMIIRGAEFRSRVPYRESGQPLSQIRKEYSMYISATNAHSFALSLRLGIHKEEIARDFATYITTVINDVMEYVDLINNDNYAELSNKITDEAYFNNIVGLAKKLAPNGKDIKQVGLSVLRAGKRKSVSFTKTSREIKQEFKKEKISEEVKRITIRGKLNLADATKKETNTIGLIDDKKKEWEIYVPIGMMNDIVKPLWDEKVVVEALWKDKGWQLEDIGREEEE